MRRRAGLAVVAAVAAAIATSSAALAAIPDTPDGALASPRVATGTGGAVSDVVISGSGRYVVFVSSATNLYSGQTSDETSPTCEVFRRDLLTGTTIMVSRVTNTGSVGNGCSSHPAVDYDGNVIGFLTTATNLGASSGAVAAAVVRNITANTLTTASVANGSGGAPATDSIGAVAISGDGTKVAFTSTNNLASVTTNGVTQVWVRDLGAGTTTLASNADGSAASPAGAAAGAPSLNEYGTQVAFTTTSQLTSASTSGVREVYLRNLQAGSTTLVSRATGPSGAAANAAAGAPSLAADANAVAFQSSATNLGDSGGQADDYVRSLTRSTTTLADTAANGTTLANAPAGAPTLSAYGDMVAFASAATNLGADPQGHMQVWLHDLSRGLVSLASPAAGGTGGANGDSTAPSLAEGGIAVAYGSAASNLDPAGGDTNTTEDAYVRRVRNAEAIAAGSTVLITRDGLDGRSSGNQPSGEQGQTTEFAVAGDGLYVAYEMTAPLTGETGSPTYGVYVRNLETGEVELVNRNSDSDGDPGAVLGECGSGFDGGVAISSDGRYVAFAADPGGAAGCQVYVRDRQAGTTTLESVNTGGTVADGISFNPGISANGQYLIFTSQADNLTPHHPSSASAWDVYERNLQTGTTTIVSLPDGQAPGGSTFGTEASGFDQRPSVTDDGRYVVFESRDAQLEAGSPFGNGQQPMTYLRNMQTDRTLVLQQDGSSWGDADSFSRDDEISADGSTVVFDSDSENLVPGHTSFTQDIYYRAVSFDSTTGDLNSTIHIASVPTGAEPGVGGTFGNSAAEFPSISSDGHLITFISAATNYGTTASGGGNEVWQRNTQTVTTTLVSRQSGASGTPATGNTAFPPDSSADGSVIAFETASPNLDPDGTSFPLGYVRTQSKLAVNGTPEITGDLHDGSTITCNPGSWAGSPSFTYAWLRGAGQTVISGQTAPTYNITDDDVDGPLACRVTAGNGDGTATSPSVTALPDPPVNTGLPQLGGGTQIGTTATCTSGHWTATPTRDAPTQFAYQWLANGAPITGAISSSHLITAADGGAAIACQVTATNTGGSKSATSTSFTPTPLAPTSVKPPLLNFTAPATNGTLVICDAGTWTGNPTVTVSWDRNGLTIPGAGGRTYLIGTGDVHSTINCTETAVNAGGTGRQDSSNTTGVIRQTAPIVEKPPTPNFAGSGFVTCEPAKFSYAAPDTFTWYRDGTAIGPGQTAGSTGPGQVYKLAVADLGHSLSCHETETNSDGASATAISGSLAIQNTVCELAGYIGEASDSFATSSPLAQAAGNTGGEVPVIPAQPHCKGFIPSGTATPAPPGSYDVTAADGTLTVQIQCPAIVANGCAGQALLVTSQLPALKIGSIARAAKPAIIARVRLKIRRKRGARIHLHLDSAGKRDLKRSRLLRTSLIFVPRHGAPELIAYLHLRR